jgi:ribulose-phosphate 3-epimerase
MVLIMSVNPGFGGQQFIQHSYEKIRTLRRMIHEKGLAVKIEVDGGVTVENAKLLVDAGVDVLVAGNTVFAATDPADMIKILKAVA